MGGGEGTWGQALTHDDELEILFIMNILELLSRFRSPTIYIRTPVL